MHCQSTWLTQQHLLRSAVEEEICKQKVRQYHEFCSHDLQ